MFKHYLVAATVLFALFVGLASANSASAHWRHRCNWPDGPYLAGPPIILGGYYPARYYYGYPVFYGPNGYGYRANYGSGIYFSVGF
jgi:hypothetical protein